MMLKHIESTEGHAQHLAQNLRDADRAEIQAASGQRPLDVLLSGFSISEPCRTIVAPDGEPLSMFGVVPIADRKGVGAVWLLASPRLVEFSRSFLRQSRAVVAELHRNYPVLFNYTDARNTVHHKWLRWCGFKFIKTHDHFGVERRPFIEFYRLAEPCANPPH